MICLPRLDKVEAGAPWATSVAYFASSCPSAAICWADAGAAEEAPAGLEPVDAVGGGGGRDAAGECEAVEIFMAHLFSNR